MQECCVRLLELCSTILKKVSESTEEHNDHYLIKYYVNRFRFRYRRCTILSRPGGLFGVFTPCPYTLQHCEYEAGASIVIPTLY